MGLDRWSRVVPLRTDSSTHCPSELRMSRVASYNLYHMTAITRALGGGCATVKSARDKIATGDGTTRGQPSEYSGKMFSPKGC